CGARSATSDARRAARGVPRPRSPERRRARGGAGLPRPGARRGGASRSAGARVAAGAGRGPRQGRAPRGRAAHRAEGGDGVLSEPRPGPAVGGRDVPPPRRHDGRARPAPRGARLPHRSPHRRRGGADAALPRASVGAGALARLTARALLAEMPLRRLTLWNRTRERALALARELAPLVETAVAASLESAVREHRVIVTVTASTAPLVRAAWVRAGTHVTSAGTGSPEKVELEPALLARADKLVADRVAQTERYGNLRHAIAAGFVTRERVYAELGELAAGRRPGRERPDEITVADLTGVGVQDAAIAQAVVEALAL